MHSSHSRLATTISIGLLIAAACTSASTPARDVTPTASPSITAAAAASPTAAATPASPSPSATPQPTSKPTPVPVPSKPTGVTFDEETRSIDDGQFGEVTQTVTWGAPRSEGVEIRVYGVTECIAEPADPAPGTNGPCLVVDTPLPASVRRLLATAAASDGEVSWTWAEEGGCDPSPFRSAPDGPGYRAIVLAAYGPSGHSIFAIAEPGEWWRAAPGDIIC
jgi:hypothetical protein